MKITQAQFDAMAADMKALLEKHGIPRTEIEEVMRIAASTAPDIVEVR